MGEIEESFSDYTVLYGKMDSAWILTARAVCTNTIFQF